MSAQIRIFLVSVYRWIWTNAWQSGRVNMHIIRVLVLMRWKTISCVVILRLALICLETVQIVAPCPGCAPGHGLPLSLSLGPLPANIWGQSPSRGPARPEPVFKAASSHQCWLHSSTPAHARHSLLHSETHRGLEQGVTWPTKLLNGQVGNVSWQTI